MQNVAFANIELCIAVIDSPNAVVKLQQKVMVTVTEVDIARKRIALSMKPANEEKKQSMGILKAGSQKPQAPGIVQRKPEKRSWMLDCPPLF